MPSIITSKYHYYKLTATLQIEQRVKVKSEFSEWLEIKSEAPQGSALRPLFFTIFINDLLLEVKESEICNFSDDTTIYMQMAIILEV